VGIAVGDFLSHGRPDILVTKSDGTVNVLANNGNGTFQSPIVSQFGSSSIGSPKVADLFGDGKLSPVSMAAGVVRLFRGNGDGTFQAPVDYLAGTGTTAVATTHLDAFGQFFFDIDVPAGTHSITAVFNGDGNFNGSISTPIELTI
jgi:hypothetical protein